MRIVREAGFARLPNPIGDQQPCGALCRAPGMPSRAWHQPPVRGPSRWLAVTFDPRRRSVWHCVEEVDRQREPVHIRVDSPGPWLRPG